MEAGSKAWANIQGATSRKFGIYFVRSKKDPTRKYRFVNRFGTTKENAFIAVKTALLNLVAQGAKDPPDYKAIDANRLSQMFKAKILSLYYPNRFLAVCCSEHLEILGTALGFKDGLPSSQYQNLLLRAKWNNLTTRKWSAPKFMAYLYKVYMPMDLTSETNREISETISTTIEKSAGYQSNPRIRRAIEDYAMHWAYERLKEKGLAPVDKHKTKPYDFLCTAANADLYVEVKGTQGDGRCISLTPNEVKHAKEHKNSALFIVYGVDVKGEKMPKVSGGKELFLQQWDINSGELEPIGFTFTLPENAFENKKAAMP